MRVRKVVQVKRQRMNHHHLKLFCKAQKDLLNKIKKMIPRKMMNKKKKPKKKNQKNLSKADQAQKLHQNKRKSQTKL